MKYSSILSSLFIAGALAVPTTNVERNDYVPCTATLYSEAMCCAAGVGGLLELDCAVPTKDPNSAQDFESICASGGQQPACCLISLLGLAVACQPPTGA